MKPKNYFLIFFLIAFGTTIWYFNLFHKPVEIVDVLIGQNDDYAIKEYFHSDPDYSSNFNINKPLNEFQGGLLSSKITIWTAKKDKSNYEILYAIRYKNQVNF